TGVTVPQWSSILMLRNLKSPETYFQAAFRVQSPWSIKNPNGDNPNEEEILKPVCFVFDFAPTRALRQLSEYAIGLSPNEPNPENAVKDLVSFLPVLAYDGANMTQIDAGGILDIAMAGTSATLLARKWESALLVNVDNDTLRRIINNEEAMKALERIEGWRALGDNVIETIINKNEKVKELKRKAKSGDISEKENRELTAEEKEFKSMRKLVQEKLVKFATRIPAFMYLTDFRENTLQDVITKLEPDLFLNVTGLTVADFHLLVRLKVFNTEHMNQAVFAFRRYEDASLSYSGIDSHSGLARYGLYDTAVEVIHDNSGLPNN
ncbi:MAG: restriction endonuclease, partial [Armatimonadetes bacterium]|nr:restriction endonuclease [Armatimonadota bacterium]